MKKAERSYFPWTDEDIMYLEDKWGVLSRASIARNLKRTVLAVQLKAQRLGLGDPLTHIDGLTINQLAEVLDSHYSILKNWIKKYEFPARRKNVARKQRVWIVSYSDFWKWAEENKQMLDFTRIERLSIGPEPAWVERKRKADELKKLHKPKPHNTPWSKNEIEKLKWMLNQHKYTYLDISEEIKRSQGAIKRKIFELGLKARPVRLNNHVKYTPIEEKELIEMLEAGYCFEEIATRLGKGRSALGVRGKIERMGYKFKNGVPYLDEEEVM